MNKLRTHAGRTLVFAMLLMLVAPWMSLPAAHAASGDLTEIALNDGLVAKFMNATRALNALLAAHPQLRAQMESAGNAKTMAETVARLNAVPGVKAAISSAGMSTHDYVLSSVTLAATVLSAGFVESMHTLDKMKPGLDKDNIEYLLSHKKQMTQLMQLMKASARSEGDTGQ